jgi:hypothetical protein
LISGRLPDKHSIAGSAWKRKGANQKSGTMGLSPYPFPLILPPQASPNQQRANFSNAGKKHGHNDNYN